jgi:hypothetical protein
MGSAKTRQSWDDDSTPESLGGRYVHHPAETALGADDTPLDVVRHALHLLRLAGEFFSGRRELETARRPLEQSDARVVLKRSQSPPDGCVTHTELARGGGDASGPVHEQQETKVVPLHRLIFARRTCGGARGEPRAIDRDSRYVPALDESARDGMERERHGH